jgi:hypothetical protein
VVLGIQGAFKKFGEWYQEKNKKEDTNKITVLAFKMVLNLHNTMLATFIKVSGKVSLGVCRRRWLKRLCLSKLLGEWYQKTNKKRRYKQINYIGF